MNHEPTPQSVQAEVLATISTGSVTMRPKWYFVVKTIVLYTSTMLMSLFAVLIVSFTVFAMKRSGLWFAPSFGSRGWLTLLLELPWLLVLSAALLMLLTQLIIRRFAFSYSRPALVSAGVVALVVVGGGSFIAQTKLHRYWAEQALAPDATLPLAGPLYQYYERPLFRSISSGVVTEFWPNGFRMETRAGQELTITITPRTDIPNNYVLQVDDVVVVLGKPKGNLVEAIGIRPGRTIDPIRPTYPSRQFRVK